jgi:hypothetical protein
MTFGEMPHRLGQFADSLDRSPFTSPSAAWMPAL